MIYNKKIIKISSKETNNDHIKNFQSDFGLLNRYSKAFETPIDFNDDFILLCTDTANGPRYGAYWANKEAIHVYQRGMQKYIKDWMKENLRVSQRKKVSIKQINTSYVFYPHIILMFKDEKIRQIFNLTFPSEFSVEKYIDPDYEIKKI